MELESTIDSAVETHDSSPVTTRRGALALAVAAPLALLATAKPAAAQTRDDYDPREKWTSPETRLARRLSFGLNQESIQRAKAIGFTAYLEEQLNWEQIDDSECDKYVVDHWPATTWSYNKNRMRTGDPWERAHTDLVSATIHRAVHSKRQLYERMVEFWSDHFSIDIWKDACRVFKIVEDRECQRKHALGKFPDLLKANATSPCMLYYLDNWTSWFLDPNQNYARELMELHTLGVDGGYTQQDVVEVARCLTGWSIDLNFKSRYLGQFRYYPEYHDNGAKTVLGVAIPPGQGIQDGYKVLDILSQHASTSKFISKKLIQRFLRPDPPASLIDSVAQVYQQTGGDIKAMLRVILTVDNVMAAPAKYKRPFHLYSSAMRGIEGEPLSQLELTRIILYLAGHAPFEWSPPNGYPDSTGYWSGGSIIRWNTVEWLAEGWTGNQFPVHQLMLNNGALTWSIVIDRIDKFLFGGEMATAEKQALTQYCSGVWLGPWQVREACAVAMSMPGFQLY